mmetsp:Transcript_72266/g.209294  ORF Transcript_72266/g.209294 Transcript_72266/m.209294 type:complete len:233 (-) Transcript_72266:600-1298(-)
MSRRTTGCSRKASDVNPSRTRLNKCLRTAMDKLGCFSTWSQAKTNFKYWPVLSNICFVERSARMAAKDCSTSSGPKWPVSLFSTIGLEAYMSRDSMVRTSSEKTLSLMASPISRNMTAAAARTSGLSKVGKMEVDSSSITDSMAGSSSPSALPAASLSLSSLSSARITWFSSLLVTQASSSSNSSSTSSPSSAAEPSVPPSSAICLVTISSSRARESANFNNSKSSIQSGSA